MVTLHEIERDGPTAVNADTALTLPSTPDLLTAKHPPGIEFHVQCPIASAITMVSLPCGIR